MRRSWWKLRRLKAENRLRRTETASGNTKSSLHFEAPEVQAAFACIKGVEKLNVIVRGHCQMEASRNRVSQYKKQPALGGRRIRNIQNVVAVKFGQQRQHGFLAR